MIDDTKAAVAFFGGIFCIALIGTIALLFSGELFLAGIMTVLTLVLGVFLRTVLSTWGERSALQKKTETTYLAEKTHGHKILEYFVGGVWMLFLSLLALALILGSAGELKIWVVLGLFISALVGVVLLGFAHELEKGREIKGPEDSGLVHESFPSPG